MDIGESKKNGKGSTRAGTSGPRAPKIHWPQALSEFVLDWYIEKKMELPPKVVFKKLHHNACTKVVNEKYGSTYTVEQVHRHFRRHKETWALVARHMNASGNVLMEHLCMMLPPLLILIMKMVNNKICM
uniref:Myb/SANT-like domain-containing protein n=1 Tax=Aegilops tauschii subsp. strangulata TaxID=200361 RepID=A0A453PIA1_AEGTS